MRKLTDWELENGFVRYNHFYRPSVCVLKNDEILEIYGSYDFHHWIALQIMQDEQKANPNDSYSLDIYCYIPKPIEWYDQDTQEKINHLFCDGVSIE